MALLRLCQTRLLNSLASLWDGGKTSYSRLCQTMVGPTSQFLSSLCDIFLLGFYFALVSAVNFRLSSMQSQDFLLGRPGALTCQTVWEGLKIFWSLLSLVRLSLHHKRKGLVTLACQICSTGM